jgi:flagellar hook-associated protein 3 FlgL
MRISSMQIFRRGISGILNNQSTLNTIQNKIATGKNINKPSDDPIGMAQVLALEGQIAKIERFSRNVELTENRLQLQDSTLASITNTMYRVSELRVQSINSVLSETDRLAISQELIQKLDELTSIANTRDQNGFYLFAGFQNQQQAFTTDVNGNTVYNGDNGHRSLEVADGLTVTSNVTGYELFENSLSGNGRFMIKDPGAVNTGTGEASIGDVVDEGAYVPDTYSLTFVTNSSGNLAYQVVGAASGQVIPALPAAIPADAPDYVAGNAINFNGIEFAISGAPNVGDDFVIQPSTRKNVFTTIKDMISALESPVKNPTQQAAYMNVFTQASAELDSAFNQITLNHTKIGARLTMLDTAADLNSQFELSSREVLSGIQDLDLARAATDLSAASISLEAAQQSFLRVQRLSLVNLL